MTATKKIWNKPKLIILERGRPEEMVLAGCKMAGSGISASTKKTGCEKLGNCTDCVQLSTS